MSRKPHSRLCAKFFKAKWKSFFSQQKSPRPQIDGIWQINNNDRFCLKKICNGLFLATGCARWGASGALYPKSAYAGLNSRSRILIGKVASCSVGRHATGNHEPRQVRKEAAISDAVCVVVDPGQNNSKPLSQWNTKVGAQPFPRKSAFPVRLIYFRLSRSYLDIKASSIIFITKFVRARLWTR